MRDNTKGVMIFYLGTKGAGPGLAFSMAEEVVKSGYRLRLVISDRQELKENFLEKFKEALVVANIPNRVFQALNLFKFIYFVAFCIKEIRKNNINYIVVPMHHPWSILAIFFLKFKCKILSVIHDAIPHEGDSFIAVKLANLFIVRGSDITLFLSKYQLEYQRSQIFCSHIVAGQIRHPSFTHYSYRLNSIDSPSKTDIHDFVFVGRIEQYKGLDLLLNAFALLKSKNKAVSLFIAGKPAGDLKLNDLNFEGVTCRFEYIPDSEIPLVINQGKLIVLPYSTATQSGVMSLAHQFGKLCVSTPVNGLIEQSDYTGNTIFSKDFTPESLAEAMQQTLDNLNQLQAQLKRSYIDSNIVQYLT